MKVRGTTAQYVVDHTIPGGVLRIPHGVLSLITGDGTPIASIEANTGGFTEMTLKAIIRISRNSPLD